MIKMVKINMKTKHKYKTLMGKTIKWTFKHMNLYRKNQYQLHKPSFSNQVRNQCN
jgi:hypothetical protein